MNFFYFLYLVLFLYVYAFFIQLKRTFKYSSYTTLYKSTSSDENSFIWAILSIILHSILTPVILVVTIYMKFTSLQSFISNSINNLGLYIDMKAIDWMNFVIRDDLSLLNITNPDLLIKIGNELYEFKIHALILIVSALVIQTNIFNRHAVILFEEGFMQRGIFYNWDLVNYLDLLEDDKERSESEESLFYKKTYVHFELEINEEKSLFDFLKHDTSNISEKRDSSKEKIRFKIPSTNLSDFKYALRMVNIKSNLNS